MNRRTAIRNLQIITALDSICFGLVYRSIGIAIFNSGGTHLALGILATASLIGQLLSQHITKIFGSWNGKKYELISILSLSLISHLILASTKSPRIMVITRIFFSAINQTQELSLSLLLEKDQNRSTRTTLYRNYNFLSKSGCVIGPLISAYLLKAKNGFKNISVLAACTTLINILLVSAIEEEDCSNENIPEMPSEESALDQVTKPFKEKLEELNACELERNWDLLSTKYLLSFSMTILFLKHQEISKYNHATTPSSISCTVAYMNSLKWAFTCCTSKIPVKNYSITLTNEMAFFFITILMALASHSTTYRTFWLMLVPVMFLQTIITKTWKDWFAERQNEDLNRLNNSADIVAQLTAPILFGLAYSNMDFLVLQIFLYGPLFLSWVIVRLYSRGLATSQNPELIDQQCESEQE